MRHNHFRIKKTLLPHQENAPQWSVNNIPPYVLDIHAIMGISKLITDELTALKAKIRNIEG
jgi:hypothetical protein